MIPKVVLMKELIYLFLVTYFSRYDDRDNYMWFRTEEETLLFVEDCKDLGNKVYNAMEIKDYRFLEI